ncbi:MAG: sugar transferase [Bacteroidales bacterium]|nr:sugar transferase [Bacteroidales bacterium]
MNKRKQIAKYVVWDVVASMVAWGALFLFRKQNIDVASFDDVNQVFRDINLWRGLLCVPLFWLFIYIVQGSYRDVYRRARVKEFVQTLSASVVGVVIIFFALLLDDNISTYHNYYSSFLFLFTVHFLLTYVGRLAITSRAAHLIHSRQIGFPSLIVGSGNSAYATFCDVDQQEVYSGEKFLGFVSLGGETNVKLAAAMPCLGGLDALPELVTRHRVEEVIVAIEPEENGKLKDILRQLNPCGEVIVKLTPDIRDIVFGSVKAHSIFHSPLITVTGRFMEDWQYSVKRLFDIGASVVALVVLAPLFLFTAVMVKLSSPGPVFYSQERIGKNGVPFRMHKFRSMYVDAEREGPALSRDGDPRITKWGRFMRKVRLDEIPQFYNVLRGTMSIVGPRPERQYFIDQIVERVPEYLLLQRVKPGITSWGQVRYGYAENVEEMVERLRYDLLYLENMSLMTDIKIMLYTVIIIVQGRGK